MAEAGKPLDEAGPGDGRGNGPGDGPGDRRGNGPGNSLGEPDVLSNRLYIGFGLVRAEAAGAAGLGETAIRDLLAVLQALADEGRLQAVGHIRDHGKACAADFMQAFGWSQPATSRNLRALESTGLLDVERVDGVKWYTVSPERARQVVEALERYLHPRGM